MGFDKLCVGKEQGVKVLFLLLGTYGIQNRLE
jgi:hypothetical protein